MREVLVLRWKPLRLLSDFCYVFHELFEASEPVRNLPFYSLLSLTLRPTLHHIVDLSQNSGRGLGCEPPFTPRFFQQTHSSRRLYLRGRSSRLRRRVRECLGRSWLPSRGRSRGRM